MEFFGLPSKLQAMIKSISLHRLRLPLTTPYKLAFGDVRHFDTIVSVIEGENGSIGLGEATILTGYTDETIDDSWSLIGHLAGQLIKKPSDEVSQLLIYHLKKSPFTVTSLLTAIDMARDPKLFLVDKNVAIPILGILNGHSKNELAFEVDSLLEKGFKTFKVKVGFDVHTDIEKVKNVQEIVRGRALIRIDGNQGYKQNEAIEFVSQLSPEGIELFEQPCIAGDWESALNVSKHSLVPMMLDESIYDVTDIDKAANIHCAKYIKVKLMKFGSSVNLIKAIQRIKEYDMIPVLGNGVAADIGCWMEALVANNHIKNAGEMNGFLKPTKSILENPLKFSNGTIQLEKNYIPVLDRDYLKSIEISKYKFH